MNKLFLSNEKISIPVRDYLKFITVLGVKLVLKILFFKLFVKCIISPFRTCYMKYFTELFYVNIEGVNL